MTLDKANPACRVLVHIAPYRADRQLAKELEKLQDMVEKLQSSSEADPQLRNSYTEATLMQCAHEVISKGTTMYEASRATESVAGGYGAANSSIRVAEWVSAIESIRFDRRLSNPSEMVSDDPSTFSGDETSIVMTNPTSAQHNMQEHEAIDAVFDDSDDDLDTDLAKAALETGTKAFEMQDWDEADSLLQEALRVLQQLPKQKRAFCDIFSLQYKLAVCAYYMQEPADAEEALMSLVQQPASSDEQRGYIYSAAHLLSLLYVRMGQADRARSECEKVLQARRRLLGKQSDASLESTALMAHICVLLNNRARAKSYLAMIPEARRDAVQKIVEESLGTKVEYLDSLDTPSLRTRSTSGASDLESKSINRFSESTFASPIGNGYNNPLPAMTPQPPADNLWQPHQRIPSHERNLEDTRCLTAASFSSAEERRDSGATEVVKPNEDYSTNSGVFSAASQGPSEPPEESRTFKDKTLSRKEILERIGCQPKDRIEEAVCAGDHSVFASLLNRKKDFWGSKLRKRVRPERVTALHFAALFGEIDMARRLLDSNFNINEVPFGYSTSLTPLKFAIGARRVEMVEFLIANGAKPSEPDSWSTLAGQLMNRSWLMKTMSDAEKEYVPSQIIAIFRILLKHGWKVNSPFEKSGGTVLHQAVAFWTGSFKWDLRLRAAITSFLCEQGANPFQANTEGKTPYDTASASGHQDLLLVLDRAMKREGLRDGPPKLFELAG